MTNKQKCGGTYHHTPKEHWYNTYTCNQCGMMKQGFGHLTEKECDL